MGVSENGGTPKSSILIGFSIINHPFWGNPIFGNTHMDKYYSNFRVQIKFSKPSFRYAEKLPYHINTVLILDLANRSISTWLHHSAMNRLVIQPSKNHSCRTVSSLKLPHRWLGDDPVVRALPSFQVRTLSFRGVVGSFHIPEIQKQKNKISENHIHRA